MKRKIQIIIGASAVSALAFSVLAQDSTTPKPLRPVYSRDGAPHAHRLGRLNGAAKASDIIGMAVENPQGEKIGKVEELAVDVESGRIVQVIVSTGGFLGIGDTLSAVPPGALHHDVANKVLHLDADKAKLKDAPVFDTARWSECCDSNHLSAVYGYYGQEPAFRFIHRGDVVRSPDGVIDRDGQRKTDRKDHPSMIPDSCLSEIQKASKVMGMSVSSLQNEKLGKVDNILLDLPSGRLVALVISSGGFLGIGDELSAVPPAALRFTTDRETLQLDTTKETFAKAPHFKSNQWPDFGQTAYSGGVYRAYNVEPYFTTDLDNTQRNVRDREQGNGKADLATTAQIRKEIAAGKDMSVDAQNVKVITSDGQVTLRGPVNTAEEKRLIGDIANRIARSENVNNQLEVKLDPSPDK